MTSPSMIEDCRALIERGHESWKSYFSKWEVMGKYDEDIIENHLISESVRSSRSGGKRKKQRIVQTQKKRTLSSLISKKKLRNRKKAIKKKQGFERSVTSTKTVEHYSNCSKEDEEKIITSAMLETNLNKIFRDFLSEKNKLEIFGVLSFTISGNQKSKYKNLFLDYQQSPLFNDFQLNKNTLYDMNQQPVLTKYPRMTLSSLINPVQSTSHWGMMNFPKFHGQPRMDNKELDWMKNRALGNRFSTFENHFKNNLSPAISSVLKPEINMGTKSIHLSLLRSPNYEGLKSKPLDWDFKHKSPVSVCRKINKEYFIKRTFSKMNISQDEKRFKTSCLYKRTNSVSLDMENSNFTTPERKPSEWKCFSENVLQTKRRAPSKLFFDKEDSGSDDQIEKQVPHISCKNKKLKTHKMTEVLESDSDEYECIFDRVKKS